MIIGLYLKQIVNYKMLNIKGQSHDQQFTVACETVLLTFAPEATASSRRQAEQQAAEKVLLQLEEMKND